MKLDKPLWLSAEEVADIIKKHVESVTGYGVSSVQACIYAGDANTLHSAQFIGVEIKFDGTIHGRNQDNDHQGDGGTVSRSEDSAGSD